jgi:hypothetical protein
VDFESLELFGSPFVHEETYVYYEGRRTFAMRSTWADLFYVVNTVDEDDDTVTTLLVAVSGERFRAIRSGIVSFRAAYTEAPPGSLFVVVWYFSNDNPVTHEVQPIQASILTDSWLPLVDARLRLPTETELAFREADLLQLSRSQSRTVFAVEVGGANNVTQLPVRTSGELQVAVDGQIDALYAEASGSNEIVRELVPMFLGVRAASFVLVMAIESARLVEPSDISAVVFENFGKLIDAAASEDESLFIEEMKRHNPRVRNRFRDVLRPLAAAESGLTLVATVAFSGTAHRSSATAQEVGRAYDAIEHTAPEVIPAEVTRGVLLGMNVRTGSFEIQDLVTMQTFKGHMDSEVQEQARGGGFVVGESGYVKAAIRIEVPFAADPGELGTKYFLESMDALEADS